MSDETALVLSPADTVSMLQADHAMEVARLQHDAEQLRGHAAQLTAQLEIQRTGQRIREAAAGLENAAKARGKVVVDLEHRYGVTLRDLAFEPLTGQLKPLPKEPA